MAANPDYYTQLLEAFGDVESQTVLVVAGATREQVAQALGVDLNAPIEDPWRGDDGDLTGWALLDVPGGVLALEPTGYGDPSLAALRKLSRGGAAAVVRSNIQAHERFGCARAGELLFDDDEYVFIDDPEVVPAELRHLFDLVWDDLEDEYDDSRPDPFAVGLAMAEVITALELTAQQVEAASRSEYFKAPTLVYASQLDD